MPILGDAWIKAYDTQDEDNLSQAGNLYCIMSEDQKNQLARNIAVGLSQATASAQERMLAQCRAADRTRRTGSARPSRKRNGTILA